MGERHRLLMLVLKQSHKRSQKKKWREMTMVIHALGEDWSLVVAIGDSDTDRGGACAGGHPGVYGHHHKLVDVIGPLVVEATGGADHTSRRDDEVTAVNEVRELRVHAGVTVPGQNCGGGEKEDMNEGRNGEMGGRRRRKEQWCLCVSPCSREVPGATLSGMLSLV